MPTEERPATDQRRLELAAFLRACRKRLTPEQVDLPVGERRRVKGLRREEVAGLAGIGSTWYTWLEQGRPIKVSEATLDHLAQALHLSEAERAYLFLLAAPDPTLLPAPLKPLSTSSAEGTFQSLLDALHPNPALLRDQHWDILGWNRAEADLNPWPAMAAEERNMLLYLFIHPHARHHLPQWEDYARSVLQIFRLTSSQFASDQRFPSLIRQLQASSREFGQWWQEYTVQQHPPASLVWQAADGKRVDFSIFYLSFPLHTHLTMRVLFPQAPSNPIPLSSPGRNKS